MSDDEYVEFKDKRDKWPYYQEKLPNEKRILSMDVALIESHSNDNTAFWITREIPDGGKYRKIYVYAESMHGINSNIQALRAKQLFYEFECDVFTIDGGGNGMAVVDNLVKETYDKVRNETYPAWSAINPEDFKTNNRVLTTSNVVPVMYVIKTAIQQKSHLLTYSNDLLQTNEISFLVDTQEAIEYLDKIYKYHLIEDEGLKARLLNPYVQTTAFVNEAIALEKIITQGYPNVQEKSGKRKDRVMSMVYNLAYAEILDEEIQNPDSDNTFLDYIMFA